MIVEHSGALRRPISGCGFAASTPAAIRALAVANGRFSHNAPSSAGASPADLALILYGRGRRLDASTSSPVSTDFVQDSGRTAAQMPCPDISLILACYNEEAIIEDRTEKIFEVLDALHLTSEVIFVDDASCDGTGRMIEHILIKNSTRDLCKIVHAENAGRGGAVSDGMLAARGRFVGFIDLDLEIKPSYILPCLLALQQGYDVATACRVYKLHLGSLHRHIMSWGYGVLVRWHTAIPLRDTETGFKFFRRDRILPILEKVRDKGWFWDTEIMVQAYLGGLRITEISAEFERCTDKTSSVKIWRDSLIQFKKLRELSRTISDKPGEPT